LMDVSDERQTREGASKQAVPPARTPVGPMGPGAPVAPGWPTKSGRGPGTPRGPRGPSHVLRRPGLPCGRKAERERFRERE
jgi:hypothetical protein